MSYPSILTSIFSIYNFLLLLLLLFNNKFYLEKIEVNIDGYEIPIIGFNIYAKINENNLYKLNLFVCFNENIDLYIPINLTENLDEDNLSSGYFNDICYSASSDKGTDIIRKDRIKNFIEKNKTKCQNDCVFSEYIEQFKKAKCTCNVKKIISSFKDFNINKTKFYENYIIVILTIEPDVFFDNI